MEAKFYTMDVITRNQRAIAFKSAKNVATGYRRLKQGIGEIKPFEGYPNSRFENQLNIGVDFTTQSQQDIIERVTGPLAQIAQEEEVQGIFPGFGDQAPHLTLQRADFTHMSAADIQAYIEAIKQGRAIDCLTDALVGTPISFNKLVVGESSYICAPTSSALFVAREWIDRMVTGADSRLTPQNFSDIVHSSVGRITQPAGKDRLARFYSRAREIHSALQENPLTVEVAGVFADTSANIIARDAAHLIQHDN